MTSLKSLSLSISSPALAVAFVMAISISAHADSVVAGWDFSQYAGDGTLITDSDTFEFTNVLDANYSDFDESFGAGPDSGIYGTLYFDGTAGSTNVPAGLNAGFLPTQLPFGTGSLASNLGAPAGVPFDSHTVLDTQGQDFTEYLAVTASCEKFVVFEADLSSMEGLGEDWWVSFGGRTFSGVAAISVEFSTDGEDYLLVDTVMLTDVDSLYELDLSMDRSDLAYVRLGFSEPGAGGLNQPIIDNVAIIATVPEPLAATSQLAALITLAGLSRRIGRSRRSRAAAGS